MAKRVIANDAICACVSGAQFFVWVDVDKRRRCTNCNNLARIGDVPSAGTAVYATSGNDG